MKFLDNILGARTIREGSVGIFIIAGFVVFGIAAFWLRGLTFSRDSYKLVIQFNNTNGMKLGGNVRYRGFNVGKITAIDPNSNGVDVTVTISPHDLLIPRQIRVEANQSGFISETNIDIIPLAQIPQNQTLALPLDKQCDSSVILCNEDVIEGALGISFDDAIKTMIEVGELMLDPAFMNNFNSLTGNASKAAAEAAKLGGELTELSKAVRGEVKNFSQAASTITNASASTAEELSETARAYRGSAAALTQVLNEATALVRDTRTVTQNSNQLVGNASELMGSAQKVMGSADRFVNNASELAGNSSQLIKNADRSLTNTVKKTDTLLENSSRLAASADQLTNNASKLVTNANSVLLENRGQLVSILGSIEQTSDELRRLTVTVTDRLDSTDFQPLLNNLEVLTANAAAASANLKDVSNALNDPNNLIALQRTLNAARVTFENVQKITSDLDELTGDPKFRSNLLRLVNGLSELVSTTTPIKAVEIAEISPPKSQGQEAIRVPQRKVRNYPVQTHPPKQIISPRNSSNRASNTASNSGYNIQEKPRKKATSSRPQSSPPQLNPPKLNQGDQKKKNEGLINPFLPRKTEKQMVETRPSEQEETSLNKSYSVTPKLVKEIFLVPASEVETPNSKKKVQKRIPIKNPLE